MFRVVPRINQKVRSITTSVQLALTARSDGRWIDQEVNRLAGEEPDRRSRFEKRIAMIDFYMLPVDEQEFWLAQVDQAEIDRQLQEDTCERHGSFCCEQCFDMSTVEQPLEDTPFIQEWLETWAVEDKAAEPVEHADFADHCIEQAQVHRLNGRNDLAAAFETAYWRVVIEDGVKENEQAIAITGDRDCDGLSLYYWDTEHPDSELLKPANDDYGYISRSKFMREIWPLMDDHSRRYWHEAGYWIDSSGIRNCEIAQPVAPISIRYLP